MDHRHIFCPERESLGFLEWLFLQSVLVSPGGNVIGYTNRVTHELG